MQPRVNSPVAEEAAKLAEAMIGKLGNPLADQVFERFARHAGGHAELVDDGDCALCNTRTATTRATGEAARHLGDAGRSLIAAATALLTPPAQPTGSTENGDGRTTAQHRA